MAANGAGGGEGGQPGNNQQQQQSDSQRQNSQSGQDWGQFQAMIDGMGERFAERIRTEVGDRIDSLRGTVESGFQQPEPDPNEGFDFDAATPRQLYDHMTGQFQAMMEHTLQTTLDQVLGPHVEQINNLRRDLSTDQGTRQIQAAQAKFKDFSEWGKQMIDAAKQHPTLDVTGLYHHVRAMNPDRAKELDLKYNPPAPPPPRPFSIGPSSASASSPDAAKPLSKTEAAQKAYTEVAARHPGVLPALEDAFGYQG